MSQISYLKSEQMNTLKKLLGILWLLLAPALVVLMAWQAWDKIGKAAAGTARLNTTLQWSIILLVFIPICTGLAIFGYYALKGAYAQLPEKSDDLED